LVFTIQAPTGGGASGLLINGSAQVVQGSISILGPFYSTGSMQIQSVPSFNITGALLSAGALSLTPGNALTINYDPSALAPIFGGAGDPEAVQVEHWEEEY
jgi:hypothetical protein